MGKTEEGLLRCLTNRGTVLAVWGEPRSVWRQEDAHMLRDA